MRDAYERVFKPERADYLCRRRQKRNDARRLSVNHYAVSLLSLRIETRLRESRLDVKNRVKIQFIQNQKRKGIDNAG